MVLERLNFSTLRRTAEALPLAVDDFVDGASDLRPGVRDERRSRTPRLRDNPALVGPRARQLLCGARVRPILLCGRSETGCKFFGCKFFGATVRQTTDSVS